MVAGILVAGYVRFFVLPPRQLVVQVDDVKYTRGDLVKLLRVRQHSVEASGLRYNTSRDIFQAIQGLVGDEIIAKGAPDFGISVTDDEIDFQIRTTLAGGQNLIAGQGSSSFDRQLKETYRRFLNSNQISEGEHRELVRKGLLRAKVREFLGQSVPTATEQVHTYRLAMAVSDEIDIMQIKFQDTVAGLSGADALSDAFKDLVREFSRDEPETVRKGGDLGWVPLGVYEEYEYGFFELEVGELSAPIPHDQDPNQIIFFMVSERDAERPLSPISLGVRKGQALQEWINQQRANHEVVAVFDGDIYEWVLGQLRLTTTFSPTPLPNPLRF